MPHRQMRLRNFLPKPRLHAGMRLPSYELSSVRGEPISIPQANRLVHLQFRRFAGCPVCKLHLRDIAQRHQELLAAGINEVAVFHSTEEVLRKHGDEFPFHLVADPQRHLYAEFGVTQSLTSVLHPRAWGAIVRGLATFGPGIEKGEPALGLPADFLIGTDGRLLACKYGSHADDHWSVDEILDLANASPPATERTNVSQSVV